MSKYQEALERLGAEKLARGELIRNDSKVEPYLLILQELVDKETKYQVLEEELGIDLPTLFKALKDGVWYKFKTGNIHYISLLDLGFYIDHYVFWLNESGNIKVKDYGKTWWIKKPKENEDD